MLQNHLFVFFLSVLLISSHATAQENIWHPSVNDSFDWQLTEPLNFQSDAQILDLDAFDTPQEALDKLKKRGVHLVCYMNVGSWEDWRNDAKVFPEQLLGKDYEGWSGERWLDIRNIKTLAPIMRARMDLCRKKGFDALEPDNIDGYENDTGLPITRAQQVKYNLWLADEAHKRGLSIALKNAPDLLPELSDHFDWALLEDCHAQGWCSEFSSFIQKGKAVFAVEYTDENIDWKKACAQARKTGFQTILKRRKLDSWVKRCP